MLKLPCMSADGARAITRPKISSTGTKRTLGSGDNCFISELRNDGHG